ncbi:MAG TPA: BON domain-containing protein [Bryobacteraceae bacterium]|jgi:osmotically-inducible protein OsmY
MNQSQFAPIYCVIAAAIGLAGCSSHATAPDVSKSVRSALDQAGLKDVSESDDLDKAVITLGGHVPADADKAQAETITRQYAAGQVVSNQIQVLPAGVEGDAKKIDSDIDKGIENNLDAALIQDGSKGDVKSSVKNGVVVLKGTVTSQGRRSRVEALAAGIPHVQQVVNELQVKDQPATSTR